MFPGMTENSGSEPGGETVDQIQALLSERQAVWVLGSLGITPRHARKVLHAGLAGEPVRTAAATLYELEQVQALRDRPGVSEEAARASCPHGVFLARRAVSVLDPTDAQLAAVSPGWDISAWARLWFYRWLEDFGAMPVVVTLSGFVLLGAELTGFRREGDGRRRDRFALVLQEPGGWFEAFAGHRVRTWPGNAWQVDGCVGRGRPRRE